MSFDVILIPCRFSGAFRTVTNPFTKETQTVSAAEPMSPAEWKAVLKVLNISERNFDHHEMDFPDGGRAQVTNDSECISVRISNLTPDLSEFLIELLKAADWMMLRMDIETCFVASEELAAGLPDSGGREEIIVIDSAKKLLENLSSGFEQWNSFRNKIAEDSESPDED